MTNLMTPDSLRQQLTRLNLSQNGLARALAVDSRLARRWASGDAVIPVSVSIALEKMTPAEARRLLRLRCGLAMKRCLTTTGR